MRMTSAFEAMLRSREVGFICVSHDDLMAKVIASGHSVRVRSVHVAARVR